MTTTFSTPRMVTGRTGVKKHPLYCVFNNMRTRCYNPNAVDYINYGARGIKIYQSWLDNPWVFFDYIETALGPRPVGHQLDRIDNDGDYEPGNLRWVTKTQNMANSGGQRNRAGRASQYKGVFFDRRRGTWYSDVRINGKTIHLGSSVTEYEAARKYDSRARELFGEFARLNFPKGS